jgi:hypothetical protein
MVSTIKATPPTPPAAKLSGPTSQYIPPRTPEQAKVISNNVIKNLGKGMGSDANFYPAGVGQGSLFQNQQYVKDLEKELATKGSDPTQQAELLKYRAIVKSQEDQQKAAAVSPSSQSTPAPTQQAPAPAAPQTKSTPPVSTPAPAAPQSRSIGSSQSQPSSGYKGSAGSQAIQQLNPDRIADVNKIYAGDTINLPGGGTYTIKQGDTLDQIARNQSAPSAPAASTEPSTPNITAKSADTEKLPTEKVKETSEDKSLNRIKSLAGLK